MERLSGLSKLELIESSMADSPGRIATAIYDSFRSYKNDHCAVFAQEDEIEPLLASSGLDAERLDPTENFHWQGVQTGSRRKWKRIIIGDHFEWFHWYMRWQRFNAFHTVVLFRPISRMTDENRGYVDGLLTRILNKPSLHKAIVVEEASLLPVIGQWAGDGISISNADLQSRFGREEVREAILSTLYGTRLSHTDLRQAMAKTLSSKLNRDWFSILERTETSSLIRRHNNFRVLAEDGMKMVQSLSNISAKLTEQEPRYDEAFRLSRKRDHVRGDDRWVEEQILRLIEDRGWFTISVLYDYTRAELENVLRSSTPPPRAIMDQLDRGPNDPPMLNLPSTAVLRRVAERMVGDLQLSKSTWFREIGRPSIVYHKAGLNVFNQDHRCGQCAFYVSLRRRCRLWWLLDKAFSTKDPRWSKEGAHPLSPFEIYKMRNSWQIGQHSSACARFTDKKKDHPRNDIPENCEVCNEPLPESKLVVCRNCRTRYVTVKRHVRVFTAYEHEFERNYREIAGRDSASDVTRLEEETQGSVSKAMEQIHYDAHHPVNDGQDQPKTLIIYPGDRMLVKGDMLYIFKRRNVEAVPLAGTTLINNDAMDDEQLKSLESAGATIRKITGCIAVSSEAKRPRFDISSMVEKAVVEHTEFARGFAMAMARSAIHATEHIAALPQTPPDHAQASASLREQRRLFGRLEKSGPNGFLTYEALIMKQYWKCFNLPLRLVFERFGPRKRSRFVRESVTTASGRARGYSAVDAAINYLHQRRLFKCRVVNMQLGLDYNPGEGFLHRRKWNSDGLGLLLDLIDPFKFADREKLLEAVSDSRINWHEFYTSTDRHGIRFYYPKPEAIGTLEGVGEQADMMTVEYTQKKLPLMETYQIMVSDLIERLRNDAASFTPFEY